VGGYRFLGSQPVRHFRHRSNRVAHQDGAGKWETFLSVGIAGLLVVGAYAGYHQATLEPKVVKVPLPVATATATVEVTISPSPQATVTVMQGVRTVIVQPGQRTVVVVSSAQPYPSPTTVYSPCDPTPVIGDCP
jgi:membrane-associated protease RseP (regulator of RpoE activity)